MLVVFNLQISSVIVSNMAMDFYHVSYKYFAISTMNVWARYCQAGTLKHIVITEQYIGSAAVLSSSEDIMLFLIFKRSHCYLISLKDHGCCTLNVSV